MGDSLLEELPEFKAALGDLGLAYPDLNLG